MTLSKQLLAAAIAFGFVALAGAWQAPSRPAPGGNTPAPINVSAAAQSKQGTAGFGGLGVFGKTLITPAAGYALPANLQLGVNGAVGATAYCDAAGQNCVTSLGRAPTSGGATTTASTTAWVSVPISGKDAYDVNCEYRWRVQGKVLGTTDTDIRYYASSVSASRLVWGLSGDSYPVYIPKDDKTYMYIDPYGKAAAWGLKVASIEKRCS